MTFYLLSDLLCLKHYESITTHVNSKACNISGLTSVTEFGSGETLFDACSKRESGQ